MLMKDNVASNLRCTCVSSPNERLIHLHVFFHAELFLAYPMHMFCDIIIVTMNYEYKMVLDYYKMCMNYYCLVHLNYLLYYLSQFYHII